MQTNLMRSVALKLSVKCRYFQFIELQRKVDFQGRPLPMRQQIHRLYCQSARPCWNCNSVTDTKEVFFCGKCGTLREVDDKKSFFELLDVKVQHDVNPIVLTKKFRQLQSVLHPDKFSQKSSQEQSMSLEWSSLINNAYKTLSAPLNRGEYILQQNGITISEENTSVDPEFLMEMMELNEEVDEANDKHEIVAIDKKTQENLEQYERKLNDALKNKDLELVRSIIIKMKYFTRIAKSIKTKSMELGIVK